MSHSRDLLHRIAQLHDIRNIMNSMKNLAFIETRKLERFMSAQRKVVENIKNAATDFLTFYPNPRQTVKKYTRVFILMGSERGFCGDFNEKILTALNNAVSQPSPRSEDATAEQNAAVELIAVGRKLFSRLENDPRVSVMMSGADVAEEISKVINRLLEEIAKQQAKHPQLTITVLHQDAIQNQVRTTPLLPPFQHLQKPAKHFGIPPLLNLTPAEFLHELIEHYLFAVLHEIFYTSLMAENHRRLQHMQGAIQHLDRRSEILRRKYNTLRQEEITEEIEVILMTAESLESTTLPR